MSCTGRGGGGGGGGGGALMFVLIVDIEAIPKQNKLTQLHITDGDQDFPNGFCLLTHH